MTDRGLRERERCWKQSGIPADEVAYLGELRRAGQLSVEQLELAAHCGHPAAIKVIGSRRPKFRTQPIEMWGFELVDGWGREAGLRALHALYETEGENEDAYWAEILEDGGDAILAQLGYVFYGAAMAHDSDDFVRSIVAAGLVPWALGYADPCPDPPWRRRLKKEAQRGKPATKRPPAKKKAPAKKKSRRAARKEA